MDNLDGIKTGKSTWQISKKEDATNDSGFHANFEPLNENLKRYKGNKGQRAMKKRLKL